MSFEVVFEDCDDVVVQFVELLFGFVLLEFVVFGFLCGGVFVVVVIVWCFVVFFDVIVVCKFGVLWQLEVVMGVIGEVGVCIFDDCLVYFLWIFVFEVVVVEEWECVVFDV